MKKILASSIALLLLLSFAMTSCKDDEPKSIADRLAVTYQFDKMTVKGFVVNGMPIPEFTIDIQKVNEEDGIDISEFKELELVFTRDNKMYVYSGKEENKLEQETSFVVSEDNKKITFTDIEGEKMYVEVLSLTNKEFGFTIDPLAMLGEDASEWSKDAKLAITLKRISDVAVKR